jgi:ribose transport system substrate-binding protein
MKKFGACVVAGIAAVSLAACGSSGKTSSGGTSASSVSSQSSAFTGTTKLPSGKIGVLEVNAESERIQLWAQTAQQGAAKLGWQTEVIDGKGDPAAWSQGMTTLINEHVDGIITLAIDPAPILPQLQAAKAAGIPVIAAGITVAGNGSTLYAARYAPPDGKFGQVLADYLKTKFPAGTEYVVQDLSAVSGAHALITTANPLMQAAGFKLAKTQDLNPANLVPETSSTAVNLAQAAPNAKIELTCCDFAPAISVPALKQAGKTNILIAARYDNPSTLALIRQGAPVVVAAANSDMSILTAIDQIVAHKAKGAAINPTADAGKYQFSIVTKANVPASGLVYDPAKDIAPFAKTWESEYSR